MKKKLHNNNTSKLNTSSQSYKICIENPSSSTHTDSSSASQILSESDITGGYNGTSDKSINHRYREEENISRLNIQGSDSDDVDDPLKMEGAANGITDDYLVTMLREKPKHVKVLQTKDAFQRFFSGISRRRMELLLREAYAENYSSDVEAKVAKRMALMEGWMIDDSLEKF